MPEKICPICGRSSKDIAFIGNLCKDCFIKQKGLVNISNEIDYTYCTLCGSYKYMGQWFAGLGSLEETLINYLKIVITEKMKPVDPIKDVYVKSIEFLDRLTLNKLRIRVLFESNYNGFLLQEAKILNVRLNKTICPVCSSIKTQRGYNAILQIRGYPNRMNENILKEIKDETIRLANKLYGEIIKIEEIKKQGLDLYIKDQETAKGIAFKFKENYLGKLIETYKLIGINRDGSRKARLYISLRILNLRPKDIFNFKGEDYLCISKTQDGFLAESLKSREKTIISAENLWKYGFKIDNKKAI
ncbi:MAG: NMD3-related protein [Caldisphaera sp.]|jgi:nonsense-mediated mRNA decay protein 3|nr:MAG: hypothetical protein C0201_00065 [Caldisphaera sp.]